MSGRHFNLLCYITSPTGKLGQVATAWIATSKLQTKRWFRSQWQEEDLHLQPSRCANCVSNLVKIISANSGTGRKIWLGCPLNLRNRQLCSSMCAGMADATQLQFLRERCATCVVVLAQAGTCIIWFSWRLTKVQQCFHGVLQYKHSSWKHNIDSQDHQKRVHSTAKCWLLWLAVHCPGQIKTKSLKLQNCAASLACSHTHLAC